MARVTEAEVREIITTDLTDLTAFITAANLIVTDSLADEGLSSDLLKEIERWLSAHFVAIADPPVRSQKIGDGQDVYQIGLLGKSLEFTAYGQQVKILDPTGKLAQIGKRKAVLKVDDFRDA